MVELISIFSFKKVISAIFFLIYSQEQYSSESQRAKHKEYDLKYMHL